jgi:enoyl-CoA hydratase/carnithine racemase
MSQGLLSVLAAKLPTTRDYRDVMLFGNRFVGEEALKRGFVDAAGKDPQEAIKLAKELGVKWAGKARAGAVMGMLKDEVVGTLFLSLSRLASYLMFFFLASLLKYKYAKTELLGNRPGPRPTPEEMKRLQQNVAKGLMEDAKKAAAKI